MSHLSHCLVKFINISFNIIDTHFQEQRTERTTIRCRVWKVTKGICHRLEVFQNKCLRRILHIFWPNKITNAELHNRTGMLPISLEVKKRRWRWIGHVNRMPPTSIPRRAMRWTPAGNRRGRPKETWRRSMEREMKALGWSWGQVAKLAADRPRWRSSVSALCASTHEED